MALTMGTSTKISPSTRWDMRMAKTVCVPTICPSAGTNTNKPEMQSRMHAMMVMPCVQRACLECLTMRRSPAAAFFFKNSWSAAATSGETFTEALI